MKRLVLPVVFLASILALLAYRKEQIPPEAMAIEVKATPTTLAALSLPASAAPPATAPAESPVPAPQVGETAPWAHPEVMGELRSVESNVDSWRAALAKARPVLATDQDLQLQVGDMLVSTGDPVDGLAWQLLACMHCTQTDERIGYGCAAEGLCDPNLALVDKFRRDFGEQMTADALDRMVEIKTAIATNDPAALEPFTDIDQRRFPSPDEGECVQLRAVTPECPPEEIVRQTMAAFEARAKQGD